MKQLTFEEWYAQGKCSYDLDEIEDCWECEGEGILHCDDPECEDCERDGGKGHLCQTCYGDGFLKSVDAQTEYKTLAAKELKLYNELKSISEDK